MDIQMKVCAKEDRLQADGTTIGTVVMFNDGTDPHKVEIKIQGVECVKHFPVGRVLTVKIPTY